MWLLRGWSVVHVVALVIVVVVVFRSTTTTTKYCGVEAAFSSNVLAARPRLWKVPVGTVVPSITTTTTTTGAAGGSARFLQATRTNTEDSAADDSKGTTTLEFVAQETFTSPTAPLPSSSGKSLHDFFTRVDARELLIGEVGNVVQVNDWTETDLSRWQSQAATFAPQAAIPVSGTRHDGECILEVTTPAFSFPGLTLTTVTTIGSKLVTTNENMPQFQFTLIRDRSEPRGAKPIVWIFNTLTGASSSSSDATTADGNPPGRSFSSASPILVKEGQAVQFQSTAFLQVTVKFPSLLLKILPTSVEKANESGSKSIARALEKSVPANLQQFYEAYCAYLKQKEE